MATLSKHEIEQALAALGAMASSRGLHVELFAVGGAVMVLRFDARAATKDVDVVIIAPHPVSVVREMAAFVASDLSLPEDWLNDGAKGFVGNHLTGDVVFASNGITVRAASVAQMLALKLGAWRDDVDMADAEILFGALTGDRIAVWLQVVDYVPHGLELKAEYAFAQLWEALRDSAT